MAFGVFVWGFVHSSKKDSQQKKYYPRTPSHFLSLQCTHNPRHIAYIFGMCKLSFKKQFLPPYLMINTSLSYEQELILFSSTPQEFTDCL